MFFYTIIVI